jgi:hypothetical protein
MGGCGLHVGFSQLRIFICHNSMFWTDAPLVLLWIQWAVRLIRRIGRRFDRCGPVGGQSLQAVRSRLRSRHLRRNGHDWRCTRGISGTCRGPRLRHIG